MRVPGIEPGFSDRQSDVLAIILYPHVAPSGFEPEFPTEGQVY